MLEEALELLSQMRVPLAARRGDLYLDVHLAKPERAAPPERRGRREIITDAVV